MEVIQNILIVILAGYMTVDQNGPFVLSWFSVIVGMISGLIMGDMNTGLLHLSEHIESQPVFLFP